MFGINGSALTGFNLIWITVHILW